MRRVILCAALISGLATYGHAQTAAAAPSFRALNMERVGNRLTLTGDVVIVVDGMEIRAEKAEVRFSAPPRK